MMPHHPLLYDDEAKPGYSCGEKHHGVVRSNISLHLNLFNNAVPRKAPTTTVRRSRKDQTIVLGKLLGRFRNSEPFEIAFGRANDAPIRAKSASNDVGIWQIA